MTLQRLGARPDYDDWAKSVVAAVKEHRLRFGPSPDPAPGRSRVGLRRWAKRQLAKIAD